MALFAFDLELVIRVPDLLPLVVPCDFLVSVILAACYLCNVL